MHCFLWSGAKIWRTLCAGCRVRHTSLSAIAQVESVGPEQSSQPWWWAETRGKRLTRTVGSSPEWTSNLEQPESGPATWIFRKPDCVDLKVSAPSIGTKGDGAVSLRRLSVPVLQLRMVLVQLSGTVNSHV
jgi:hypothetical protein